MEKKYTVVCCSNFLNHYTLALSNELKKLFKEFYFVVSEELPGERKSMGFSDLNENPMVIKAYEDKEKARQAILNADLVLTGGYKYESHIRERVKLGKTTFYDSERLFKNDSKVYKALQYVYYWYKHHYDKKGLLFCISAYAAGDYNTFGFFKNRTYKWGYFSEALKYDNIDKLIDNKKENSLVWAGRLIDWKHPDLAIKVAKRLKEDGYNFNLNIIGNGEMEQELKSMIEKDNLQDSVHMLGSMPPEKVRKYMEESEIYLFTSDRGEGWGVVLNEAMNSGCAVIASYTTGSTPFLIKDKVNGLVYKDDDESKMYDSVKYCLDNKTEVKKIGKEAYNTIVNMWNPEMAAKRMYEFVDAYFNGQDVEELFKDDILSIAKPLK